MFLKMNFCEAATQPIANEANRSRLYRNNFLCVEMMNGAAREWSWHFSSAAAGPYTSTSNLGGGSGVEPPAKRKRHNFPAAQLSDLEAVFQSTQLPSGALIQQLASRMEIPSRTVQVWFQNRRQREKRVTEGLAFTNKPTLDVLRDVALGDMRREIEKQKVLQKAARIADGGVTGGPPPPTAAPPPPSDLPSAETCLLAARVPPLHSVRFLGMSKGRALFELDPMDMPPMSVFAAYDGHSLTHLDDGSWKHVFKTAPPSGAPLANESTTCPKSSWETKRLGYQSTTTHYFEPFAYVGTAAPPAGCAMPHSVAIDPSCFHEHGTPEGHPPLSGACTSMPFQPYPVQAPFPPYDTYDPTFGGMTPPPYGLPGYPGPLPPGAWPPPPGMPPAPNAAGGWNGGPTASTTPSAVEALAHAAAAAAAAVEAAEAGAMVAGAAGEGGESRVGEQPWVGSAEALCMPVMAPRAVAVAMAARGDGGAAREGEEQEQVMQGEEEGEKEDEGVLASTARINV